MRVPEEFEVRRRKVEELRALGIEPYAYRFDPTHHAAEIRQRFDELQGQIVRVAGRLTAKRVFGKLIFARLRDESGEVQISFERGVTESPVTDWEGVKFAKKYLDLGDFVGVEGEVYRTQKGEVTVRVHRFQFLAKGLRNLPEKWHGLRDKELRYRHRYLDLVSRPEALETFRKLSRILQWIRQFFLDRGFLEMPTPVLQPVYGGAFAKPFTTYSHALDTTLYLRISDELYLKRLLVGGYERVFEFSRDFRNEGIDRLHYPEFTILEAYAAYWDYGEMMQLVEDLFHDAVVTFHGSETLEYQGETLNFQRPFRRIDFVEALAERLGFDPLEAPDEALKQAAETHGIDPRHPRHRLLDKLFDRLVGDHLKDPTFVLDHPLILSPLAKRHREKPGRVERFELFVAGMELVNAFSELNDPLDQRRRFEEQLALRKAGDQEIPLEIDEDFLMALELGMPPAGGIGIGVERFLMLLLNEPSIRDVLLFPQLKPKLPNEG